MKNIDKSKNCPYSLFNLWSYKIEKYHVEKDVDETKVNEIMSEDSIILILVSNRPITNRKIESFIDSKYSKDKDK